METQKTHRTGKKAIEELSKVVMEKLGDQGEKGLLPQKKL